MANLERVLGGTGYALSDVVQARIYLTDFEEEREP
jgi:enamine deaminase RidA (YjgF/YER057c/UK114 family)